MEAEIKKLDAEFEAEMKKLDAEWEAEEAEFEAEMKKLDAEWEAEEAEMKKLDAERRKIQNTQEDGLYDDRTGKRIPYMNDEGDHIDFDHGWYD